MVVKDLLPTTVYDHQAGVCAVPERFLGHQVLRHFVIELEGVGGVTMASIVASPPA